MVNKIVKVAYDASSIKTLDAIPAIRLRPGMYCGSVGDDGLHHIVKEIISNAIDEFLSGYGDRISIYVLEDGTIIIKDRGRGIPWGVAEDGTETLENLFTKTHSGAKFSSDGGSGYNSSGGQNGVGTKVANALSTFLKVESRRDNKKAIMTFEKGVRTSFEVVSEKTVDQGTTITFHPDIEIFKGGIQLDKNRIISQIKEFSFLCKGLTFEIVYKQDKPIIMLSQNGLTDYIDDLCKKENRITNIFTMNSAEGRSVVELSFAFSNSYSETVKLYTNGIPNTAGTHLTGFRSAMTRIVNDVAREQKLLKEKDLNLTGEDLREGLVLVVSIKMPDPVFNGQTKDVLTSTEGRTLVEKSFGKALREWFELNPNELKAIVSKAMLSKKAKDAAKKARELVRSKSANSSFSSTLPGKLADCLQKSAKGTEIYLVEGDSAGGSAKSARDRNTQAILPLRGKVLNTQEKEFSDIIGNKEIKDMITAFGCGVGKDFDISKLRYEKIIIMTDADVDGAHIKILILTFIFKYLRQLIEKGHIYIAMPPLYRVVKGKEVHYLLDDRELNEFKAANPSANLEVGYLKGLGELDPVELKESTMDITKRRIKKISLEDVDIVTDMFDKLMGGSVVRRKSFIEANAHRANIDI